MSLLPPVLDSTESVFESKFNPKNYIHKYYPSITNIEKMVEVAHLLHQNPEGFYVINQIAERSHTPHELIENVAIFDFYRVVTEHFMEEFPERNAHILDIGGGPTVYQHIGLSLIAEHITHSEFLESNRLEILSWLHKEETSHVWDSYFMFVKQLFTYGEIHNIIERLHRHSNPAVAAHANFVKEILNSTDIQLFKQCVRTVINEDVVHGDMFKPNLGLTEYKGPYDVITSNFVAESASENELEWRISMKNMLSHVKKGGYFVQTAIKNAEWYQVGEQKIPAYPVDYHKILDLCEEMNFRILYQKILEGSDSKTVGYDGMIFTLAQKV